MFAALALIAVATEAAAGYPDGIYRRIGHPVTWIGALITWCDQAWNSETLSYDERRWRGVYVLVLLLAVAVFSGLAITVLLDELFHGLVALLLCGVLASSTLAQRSLYTAQQTLIGLRLSEQLNRVTLWKVLGGEQVQASSASAPANS